MSDQNDFDSAGRSSRRGFLATTAAAVAARPGYAAGSDVIRIGVIGCGGRGEAAAMNAMNADKGVRLVALADVLVDRAQEKRNALKVKYPSQVDVPDSRCFGGFDGYRSVIEASDVVLIANAAKFHPLHMMAAIQAGKHVFVEKPHAIDPAGVKLVQAACALARKKRLCVLSGLQSRYNTVYQETIQRVHDGAIGDIVAIQETWLRPPYVLHHRRPGMGEVEFQASNQYHFHWLSGDDVPQTLIHNLDRACWAQKNVSPIRAWGMGGRSTLRGEVYGNVFDHHAVVYEFPNNVRVYAYCRTIPNCYNENSSFLIGTKGRCMVMQGRIEGEKPWQYQGPKVNPYDLEHVALFKAIRSGSPINSEDYMIRATVTVLMGQFSCYTGKQVTWDEVIKSDYYYPPRPEDVRLDMEPPVRPGPDGIYPVFIPGETKLL
jgi:myo-inositol 2-dehydrogenase/D-chiro-inositol 1-dehydrogenase